MFVMRFSEKQRELNVGGGAAAVVDICTGTAMFTCPNNKSNKHRNTRCLRSHEIWKELHETLKQTSFHRKRASVNKYIASLNWYV